MDRKGRNIRLILNAAFLTIGILLHSCTKDEIMHATEIIISNEVAGTRAAMPDENKITDVNLFIFDRNDKLEYSIFSNETRFTTSLIQGERYSVHACINFGYRLTIKDMEDLNTLEYHMAYPDEYREGIPMYATAESTIRGDKMKIILEPERLMSLISIKMDRSRLSKGISMKVTSVKIGNCPKKTSVCHPNGIKDQSDCFSIGFMHSESECEALNIEDTKRISKELSLYMLENRQGRFSETEIENDDEKVFEDYDIRSRLCSYIEIGIDYASETWQSGKKPLVYRFYLGEDLNSLDIERNCHYHITVCPEDDGLKGDGWRVDKTGLEYVGQTSLQQYPAEYIKGDIGEKIHIGCRISPSWTPFDIGLEYLEADKAEGIYDYEIDEDGHGVTLTLKKPGSGLIYMEAGPPVNDAALFVIEVNQPTRTDNKE